MAKLILFVVFAFVNLITSVANVIPLKTSNLKIAPQIRSPTYPRIPIASRNSLIYTYSKSDYYIKQEYQLQTNFVDDHKKLWPNGIVPYEISSKSFNKDEIKKIKTAMQDFHTLTCLKFIPRKRKDKNYVLVDKIDGCKSDIGRQGTGKQSISLDGPNCLLKGVIIHELMHAIGFLHEQERTDRDDYVDIEWPNIKNELRPLFNKVAKNVTMTTVYDYDSIMHYDRYAFSKNGQPTIVPRKSDAYIGQRYKFSNVDLFEINVMYKCSVDKIRTLNNVENYHKQG